MSERGDDATESDATKREGAGRASRPELAPYLELGATVGRYVIIDRLGEGGMGVVYSAYDPELDRKVAIKLMQASSGGSMSGGEQAWLLREAQALARLAHPNVVAVHDVGSLSGNRVFVAMELVDGATLRKWLRDEPRTWRAVLPIMAAAGRGLAAAHAAHLVHRDFKPDNVLVGNDGRVRVMDFGLARVGGHQDLTEDGTVAGTPAYMAPELYAGKPADAASDQFAFGVTLFEALFGTRPFTREELMSDAPPKAKLPADTRVPSKIQRAVLRAIAIEPAQRFATMDALLAELAIDTRGKRRIAIAAGLVGVAALGAAGTYVVTANKPEPCRGIDQRLTGVWDPIVKQNVRAGFLRTKLPFAAKSFAQLERALDSYAKEWTSTAVESCRATRVRRDQTEEVLSLRQTCLDQRLDELRALGQVLADPHPLLLDKADKIGGQLEPIANCSNVASLKGPEPPLPAIRVQVDGIRKRLAEAKANLIGGKYLLTLVATQKAADEARAINYPPVLAEALHIQATALIATGNTLDAVKPLTDAIWIGVRARRDDVVTAAALARAMITADTLGKPNEAKLWANVADAFAMRSGLERVFESRRYMASGIVAALSGNALEAVAAHEKMLQASERMLGHDNPALWADEVMYATTLIRALAYPRAVSHFERAIALRRQNVGDDHADIAMLLSNAGIAYRHTGQLAKARDAFERALAMRERLFGKNNPLLLATLVNFSEYLSENEHAHGKALELIERGFVMAKQLPGEEHPSYHETATTKAEILGRLGRVDEARKLFDDVLAIETRVDSVTLPVTHMKRAELELAQHAYAVAASHAEQAIAKYEAQGGSENPELWRPLTRLAQAKLGLGDKAAAKPLLERAIAIGDKAGIGDFVLGDTRALLSSLR